MELDESQRTMDGQISNFSTITVCEAFADLASHGDGGEGSWEPSILSWHDASSQGHFPVAAHAGLITFWGMWLFVVWLTNVCEELKLLRILPPYRKFASQNAQAIADATRKYEAPPWIPHLLFIGVLVCWGLSRAIFHSWMMASPAMGSVNIAFASSLGLWATFMIADEICTQYDCERAHPILYCPMGDPPRTAHLPGRLKKKRISQHGHSRGSTLDWGRGELVERNVQGSFKVGASAVIVFT